MAGYYVPKSDIADTGFMIRVTRPLVAIDPGWLFVVAGLALCAAVMVIPARQDLEGLHVQLTQLKLEEKFAYDRLRAHADFIDAIERGEPGLVKRLAAAQLNLVPAGETPILLTALQPAPVTDWIDSTVLRPRIETIAHTPSTLGKLASGPDRLWLFGGGILCVFIGLLMGPGDSTTNRSKAQSA